MTIMDKAMATHTLPSRPRFGSGRPKERKGDVQARRGCLTRLRATCRDGDGRARPHHTDVGMAFVRDGPLTRRRTRVRARVGTGFPTSNKECELWQMFR